MRVAPPINRIAAAGKVLILYFCAMLLDLEKNIRVRWYLTRALIIVLLIITGLQ